MTFIYFIFQISPQNLFLLLRSPTTSSRSFLFPLQLHLLELCLQSFLRFVVLLFLFRFPRVYFRMQKLVSFFLLHNLIAFGPHFLTVDLWQSVFVAESMVAKAAGLSHERSFLLTATVITGFIDFLYILQYFVEFFTVVFKLFT